MPAINTDNSFLVVRDFLGRPCNSYRDRIDKSVRAKRSVVGDSDYSCIYHSSYSLRWFT